MSDGDSPIEPDADHDSHFSPLESWPAVPAFLSEDDLLPAQDLSIEAVLECSDSMSLLRRIVAGDPLGLERIIAEMLDRQAVMFHPTRVLAATQARCAWAGATEPAPTPEELTDWVAACMAEAIETLTQDDWSEERQGLPSDPMDDRYILSRSPYGLTANQARRIALLFNQQPAKRRRPLYAILVKGRPMVDVAKTFRIELGELKTLVFECLSSFRTNHDKPGDGLLPPDAPEDPPGWGDF